ncbi:hypothetical protein FRC09_002973 [Ceratobasidium sp. 395]|nr:hypothetical protein FRC09_002973 [Ceratobasidium sp. 395]
MRVSFVVASLVASASTVVGWACPPGWNLELRVPLGEEVCVCRSRADTSQTMPPDASCKIEVKDSVVCDPVCWADCPKQPMPSSKPMAKREEPTLSQDGTLERCPAPMLACPIQSKSSLDVGQATPTISTDNDAFECITPQEDLANCGGCSSTGEGKNCELIPGVRGTGCIEGQCAIYTCQKGYALVVNEQGAQECVRKGSGLV